MKKALIDTQASVSHIVSWESGKAAYETYPNSARVCEITNEPFEVYPTLVWVDCNDDVVPELFWYDTQSQTFNTIEHAEPIQPVVSGTQTL